MEAFILHAYIYIASLGAGNPCGSTRLFTFLFASNSVFSCFSTTPHALPFTFFSCYTFSIFTAILYSLKVAPETLGNTKLGLGVNDKRENKSLTETKEGHKARKGTSQKNKEQEKKNKKKKKKKTQAKSTQACASQRRRTCVCLCVQHIHCNLLLHQSCPGDVRKHQARLGCQ